MATDKHGMGIPLPADSTRIQDFPKITRETVEAIAAILAGGLTPGIEAAVAVAAKTATGAAIESADLVTGDDERLPAFSSVGELLAVVLDAARRETWLGARLADGGPSDTAMLHLNNRLGVELSANGPYLAALTDTAGRMTDLTIRARDGQVEEFVISRWADRISEYLNIPENQPPAPGDVTPAMVPLLQSIAAAAGRHADGAPLPASPVNFTANGQPARLTFPARYSDATPVPLIIQFEGVGATGLDPRAVYREPVREAGALYALCAFHGDSYGSPAAMADARAVYEHALRIAPISGVILMGNSMGGIAALNALHTGTIPNVLGVYLTDPTYDLHQRYANGRANEIKAAYGIAADGSNYAAKTAGYDPALAPVKDFRGVPIKIVHSSTDTGVVLDLHGRKLAARLEGSNPVELIDTKTGGHNTPDRFQPAELVKFITAVSGGPAGLRP